MSDTEAPPEVHPILGEYESDLLPDLTAVGVCVGNEDGATLAQQEAALTMVMRRMHAIQKGLDVQDEACNLEVAALLDMHTMQTASERARLASFKQYALNLAEMIEWPDRKKSSSTPYGTVGVRDANASVECVDRGALEDWAVNKAPQFIAKETYVLWNELKKTLDPTGELPPGVRVVPASRTPFVKLP